MRVGLGFALALLVGLSCARPPAEPEIAPRATLEELPQPRLESMAADVARDLGQARDRFEAEFRDASLEASRRAQAVGELGRHYQAYQLWSAAAACFRNARALDPGQPDWGYHLAVVSEMQGEVESAATILSELDDDSTEALLRLGRLRLELGDTEGAGELFARVLDRNASEAAAHAGLGRALLVEGDAEGALAHLERALELQPAANSLHYFMAQAERARGNESAAAAHLDQQGPIEVGFTDPRVEGLRKLAAGSGGDLQQGDAALLADDSAAAVEAYRRAVEKDPSDSSARHSLAAALASAGRIEESVAEFRRALELDPGNQNLLVGLAAAQLEMGRADESLETLRRALRGDPDSVEIRTRLAAAAERANRPQVALEAWEGVLSRDGGHLGAMMGRARALAAVGRGSEAQQELQSIVASHPDQLEARFLLAGVLASAGRYPEAVPHYRYLVEKSPRSLEARLLEATALVLAGRYHDARSRLEAAMEALPEETELADSLARLLAACPDQSVRDGEQALRLAQIAFDAENSIERAETMAMALAATGRFEEAVSWQERVVEQARTIAAPGLRARLGANLERYRRAQPAAPPWLEGDP